MLEAMGGLWIDLGRSSGHAARLTETRLSYSFTEPGSFWGAIRDTTLK